jgi:hypothetical protein
VTPLAVGVLVMMLASFAEMLYAVRGLHDAWHDEPGERKTRRSLGKMFRATARFQMAVAISIVAGGLTQDGWSSVVPLVCLSIFMTINSWTKVPTVPAAFLARRFRLVQLLTRLAV